MSELLHFSLIVIIALTGGFIQRVTGFGFGIFVMLFFPYIMPTHTTAVAVSALISCVMTVYNAIVYRKKVPYKKILPCALAALVTIPAAVYFSTRISGEVFKKILGAVLIALSIYFMFFNSRIKIKPTIKNGIIAGGTGGILGGLFSTGGPPVVLYLMNTITDNTVYFASAQFYFALTGVYGTTVRILNGIITREVIFLAAVGFAGSMVGNYVGKKVFKKLNSKKLRQIIYLGMILSGIIMIF